MRKKRMVWVTLLGVTLILGTFKLGFANPGFMNLFNDAYPSSSLKGSCMVCHTSPPATNPYGVAFKTKGKNSGAFAAIAQLDSDSDGTANLAEINAGTFPGDPNSKPTSTPPPTPPGPGPTPTPPPVSTPSSPAPEDMVIWVGKWFKVSMKNDGYHIKGPVSNNINSNMKMERDQNTLTGYIRIWSWDLDRKVIHGDLYEDMDGQWISTPFDLHYIVGNSLNFFCWSKSSGDFAVAFTARIQGKKNGEVLTTATLKTLGGYYMETYGGDNLTSHSAEYWGGGFSLTGTMVPESMVPVPGYALIH